MRTIVAFILCLTCFMVSCSDKSKTSTSESAPTQAAGRAETRGLEGASAVGYDGATIRHQVDNALNKNDAQNAETKREMDKINGR